MTYTVLPNPWKGYPLVGPLIDAIQSYFGTLDTEIATLNAQTNIPVPAGIANGETAVYNGTNWVRSSVTKLGTSSLANYPWANTDIAAAAGIVYSKLSLGGSILDSDIAAAANLHKLAGVTGTPDGTQFLRDDSTWAHAPQRVLTSFQGNPLVSISNSTSETDLFGTSGSGWTLPANTLGTNKTLRITVMLDVLNTCGATITFIPKLYFGGTSVAGTLIDVTNSGNRQPLSFHMYIRSMGATNSQLLYGFSQGSGSSTVLPSPNATGLASAILAIDSTSAQNIRLTGTLSSNATTGITSYVAIIELLG